MFLPLKASEAFASIYYLISSKLSYKKLAHDIAIKKQPIDGCFFVTMYQ